MTYVNNNQLEPRQALNKAFLKVKPDRLDMEKFKANLLMLLDRINEAESEEFHKNLVADFLKNTYYSPNYFINTKERNDLVIHNGKEAKSTVGVILEAKKPRNRAEMLRVDNLNAKAFQELVLYFLRERITKGNLEIRYLVVTNIYEWFVFDAREFEQFFAKNNDLVKQFHDFEAGRLSSAKTDFFYREIAKPAIAAIEQEITFTYFDLRDYREDLSNMEENNSQKLIDLYKIFSPEHLLKLPFANDSNTLNKPFYNELLHIIGLTEMKVGGKKLIGRQQEGDRSPGSLMENAISRLDSLDKMAQLRKPEEFGETKEEKLFNVALRLSITWINRILFLKLLEAQLIKYHRGDQDFAFLNLAKVQNYDDLASLFFDVLACEQSKRDENLQEIFANVPYLNSSLFEPTEIEQQTIVVSNLKDRNLPIFGASVLKDSNGKKLSGELNALEYLFKFLSAYSFSSDELESGQEDSEKLINAAVLGLIFEKINGYKDGSFYTPSFITMYMCRETIRRSIVQKFNEVKGWDCESIGDLYEKIGDKQEANTIINSLKICDPAVGSGHFLVSALNEIIAIKSELRVLLDRKGKSLKDYRVEVRNDKLLVYDDEGKLFAYNPKNEESQRVQEALFHEKQTIIENCLFGVDINPNSVTICRLRLWIELLKNAYYRVDPPQPPLKRGENMELETLPNIDINIKCGNSLISRFGLDADLRQALKTRGHSIESYKAAVQTYRNAENKDQKRDMERLINEIKGSFRTTLQGIDPNKKKLRNLEGELSGLEDQTSLLEETKAEQKTRERKIVKLHNEIDKLRVEIEDIESGKIYENALEWRFEFPEVLNDDGDFIGFDMVIGNPPYMPSKNLENMEKAIYHIKYKTVEYQVNTFGIFIELGINILKPRGKLCFIIPNYWLATKYDKRLREFLIKENQISKIVNVYNVFESAVVDTLLLFSNKEKPNNEILIQSIDRNLSSIEDRLDAVIKSSWIYDNEVSVSSLDEELIISLENNLKIDFDYKIGDFFDLKFGVKLYQVGKGKPPQTKKESANKVFEASEKIDSSYFLLLRARNIQKYYLRHDKHHIKYGVHLAEPRSIQLFEGSRILIQRIVSRETLDAMYTEGLLICNTDIITLKPKNQDIQCKFYLAILCSKLCAYVIRSQNINLDRNAFPKINTATLSTFPVPKYKHEYINITSIVDKILTAKKGDHHVDTSELEKAIDRLVYQLYGLTEEEIKIVEGER